MSFDEEMSVSGKNDRGENGCNHITKLLIRNEESESETKNKEDNGCNHNTKLLIKENGLTKEDDEIEIHRRPNSAERWRKAKDDIIKNRLSWKWVMDEITTDETELASRDDGCCKWIKRFLTIGNIGVIMACFCLLIASFVVCFKK